MLRKVGIGVSGFDELVGSREFGLEELLYRIDQRALPQYRCLRRGEDLGPFQCLWCCDVLWLTPSASDV